MLKRLIPTLLLAALALPGTAAAKSLDVEGPLKITGKGALRAELSMESPSETRAVTIGGKVGAVRFVDLAGDMRVTCKGRGRTRSGENGQGQSVVVCKGKGGRAKVHGSKFRILLAARVYGVLIPKGVTGSLHGTFRAGSERAERRAERGDRAERARDRAQRLKERAEKAKERRDRVKEERPRRPADDEPAEDDEPPADDEPAEEEEAMEEPTDE